MAWTTRIRCERMNNDRKEISYYTETRYPTISRFCDQEVGGLEAYAIACIPPASLTGSRNFDDLPSTEPVISRYWISKLDARQLRLFEATCSEQVLGQKERIEITTTHYFSRSIFFSSVVKTSWRGTSV